MTSPRHPLEIRAKAMEMLHNGYSIAEVSRHLGCYTATVSRWYMNYLGYRGKEGFAITLFSKMDNITENDDIIEYQSI